MSDALEQREIVTLLLMPFVLMALALGLSQTWRHPARTVDSMPTPPAVVASPSSPSLPSIELAAPALRLPPGPPTVQAPQQVTLAPPVMVVPRVPPDVAPAPAPEIALPAPRLALPQTPPAIEVPDVHLAAPALVLPARPPEVETPPVESPAEPRLAMPLPPIAPLPVPVLPEPVAPPPSDIAACPATPGFGLVSYAPLAIDPALGFGEKLALAARAQLDGVVVYNDKYRRMAFPMGDTHALYGVCTDVIVRAYRALGVDLQELVQKARVGSGDTNIDHRRTETLRRFLASRGQSLPVTSHPENYQPGDIVTYHRPQNRHSRSHIAIVSDVVAPSGRPMIVHNRGWGAQLEDALFVDKITGHYRYHTQAPAAATVVAAAPTATASPPPAKLPAVVEATAQPVQSTTLDGAAGASLGAAAGALAPVNAGKVATLTRKLTLGAPAARPALSRSPASPRKVRSVRGSPTPAFNGLP